jgi:hypothetical protein
MTFDRIIATLTLHTIVAFEIIVASVILLVSLQTSSHVMWRKERLCNFRVLQRVHISNLVLYGCEMSSLALSEERKLQVFEN